jgi:hypothetical protein
MAEKIELDLEKYLEKLQEAANEVANERKLEKIKVIHLSKGKFGCMSDSTKICLQVLAEAEDRVNKNFGLKAPGR